MPFELLCTVCFVVIQAPCPADMCRFVRRPNSAGRFAGDVVRAAYHLPRSAALLCHRRAESRHHPNVVSERIGHANVEFFLQTYAHVVRTDDRDAAEQAAAFLIGDRWDFSEHDS
jgi:hypothetical protein